MDSTRQCLCSSPTSSEEDGCVVGKMYFLSASPVGQLLLPFLCRVSASLANLRGPQRESETYQSYSTREPWSSTDIRTNDLLATSANSILYKYTTDCFVRRKTFTYLPYPWAPRILARQQKTRGNTRKVLLGPRPKDEIGYVWFG